MLKAFQCFSIQECDICCCSATAAGVSSLWYLWCFPKQIWLHPNDGLKVWGGRESEEEEGRSAWGLPSLKVRKSINSWWWIIRFRQPLPGGMNVHMLYKDRTGTSAEQHHDSIWLIGCGLRWGTLIYVCLQRFSQNRRSCRPQDWNVEPDMMFFVRI